MDHRVRLKCLVPLCDNYGRNLLCPPNTISIEEARIIISSYESAMLIQLEADYDSSDRSSKRLDGRLEKRLSMEAGAGGFEKKLHSIVSEVEAAAFKSGFYLAAGLTGSECMLCAECVGKASGRACRHPFEARPSMQAMGIDVIETSKNAGMPVSLSSNKKVQWTGLVLLD